MNKTRQDLPCPRILIVDDDVDHAGLLRESLRMYYKPGGDGDIIMVHTGEECLAQRLKSFDVVLLDLHLPDMTGLEVLKEILARVDLPVIFVTGENDLAVAAEAIQTGAQDYVLKHGDYLFAIPAIVQKNISLHKIKQEHDRLQMRLKLMLQELQHKNEQLEESMKQLRRMATTDALTGLYNRRYFNEQLSRQFSQAARYGEDLSCCMMDLDHYKQLNDSLGHQMGDKVLQQTAEEICASLRTSDIAARYGGDEFVLLLPNTGLEKAVSVAERIRELLAQCFRAEYGMRLPVTLSVGIASLKHDFPTTPDGLVSMADRALYLAKEQGKDRIVLFSDARTMQEQGET